MYNALVALYVSIYDKSKEKAQKMCPFGETKFSLLA